MSFCSLVNLFLCVTFYNRCYFVYQYKLCIFTGLLLYVSIDVPYMPPMMVPSKHHSNYNAVIRVVVGEDVHKPAASKKDELVSNYVDVRFQVRTGHNRYR